MLAPAALERFAGGDPLTVVLAGVELPGNAIGPVSIVRGRPTADQRPDAGTCALTLKAEALAGLPELGDPITVELSADMLAALAAGPDIKRRFTGTITDAAVRPTSGLVAIVAAGPRSRAARVPIGDVPWPAELDGARATRILAALLAADPSFLVGVIDPGTVTVLARDVDSRPAAALLDELAAFTGGDCWETRAGELEWRDARSRGPTAPALTLLAANVLVDPEFSKSLDGLVTHLTVGYGLPVFDPGDGSTTQALVVISDDAAPITALAARVSTPLASEADATAYAIEIVGRRSRPSWRVPALSVDVLRTLTEPGQREALLGLDPGSLLALSGMPALGPFTASELWVEGARETYTPNAWRLTLSVTPRGLTGAQARWIDVPPTYAPRPTPADPAPAPAPMDWGAAPFAGLSWIAVVGWWTTEEITAGRWADVPAGLRWSNYPSLTEWGDLP